MRWPLLLLFFFPIWFSFTRHFSQLMLFLEETRLQHGFMLQFLVLGEGTLHQKLWKIAESGIFIFAQFPLIYLLRSIRSDKWVWIGLPLVFLTQWQVLVLKTGYFSNALWVVGSIALFFFFLFLFLRQNWAGIWFPVFALVLFWWIQVQGFLVTLGISQLSEHIWVIQWFSAFLVCDLFAVAFDFLGELKNGKPKLAALVNTVGSDMKWTIVLWSAMILGGLFFFQSGPSSAWTLFTGLILFTITHLWYRIIIFPCVLSILPFKQFTKK